MCIRKAGSPSRGSPEWRPCRTRTGMSALPPVRRRHRTFEHVRTWPPRLSIAVGRARPSAARANSNYRQSDDGRPVDALRTAPGQGLTENRQDHGSEAVQSQAGGRLAGNCNDGEEAATGRYRRLAIVARRLRRRALIVVLMGGAVSMDVKVAAMVVLGSVIVNADVTFGQAMGDGGIVGKRKGDRRRENAKRVERGNNDRRFDAKSLGQGRHRASWHSMRRKHPMLQG